jgi:hypothetical protein
MSTMISEVYDALISAGAPEEKARKAAEAVAVFDRNFSEFDKKLTVIEMRLVHIERELTMHRWLFGIIFAMQAAILVKLFVQ